MDKNYIKEISDEKPYLNKKNIYVSNDLRSTDETKNGNTKEGFEFIPKLSASVQDFIHILNDDLDNLNITIERKEQLEEQYEFILKKIKNIPIDENKQKEIVIPINDNNNEAIECYNKALEINPQNADAYNNKGLSLYYIGNNNEAIECYNKALEINPQNADAFFNKAQALSTLEKYSEAIEYYNKALEINSNDINALCNKSWYIANYLPTRLNEASDAIKKAIGLDPTNGNIMYTYAHVLYKLKIYEEAIIVYEHIIKQNPDHAKAWYGCARTKSVQNDNNIQKCIYDLQKAIDLNSIYKDLAKDEPDFIKFKDHIEFKKILDN
ncbi:MAG TPA: tetratricopeptide repeat protein [Verrucomicrobiae bacterium]|nr:tetratricopeptide repeat protein [Verrucomicrobiae bacterium]